MTSMPNPDKQTHLKKYHQNFLTRFILVIGSAIRFSLNPVFQWVGALANVFWMNQIRARRISSFFHTQGVAQTFLHVFMFLLPPLLLQTQRQFYDNSLLGLIEKLERDNETNQQNITLARTITSKYTSTYGMLNRRQLVYCADAAGYAVQMCNVLPFILTLLDVYCGVLTDEGDITQQWIWWAYVSSSLISGTLFGALRYADDQSQYEALAKQIKNAIDTNLGISNLKLASEADSLIKDRGDAAFLNAWQDVQTRITQTDETNTTTEYNDVDYLMNVEDRFHVELTALSNPSTPLLN